MGGTPVGGWGVPTSTPAPAYRWGGRTARVSAGHSNGSGGGHRRPPGRWWPSPVPSSWLVPAGLLGVAWPTQAAAVPRVVWVESLVNELAPAEGVVVGVHAGGFAAQDAHRIAGEDGRAELGLVPAVVAALPCCAALLLGFPLVVGAPSTLGVLGAAGYGADAPASTSPHGASWVVAWPLRRRGW